MDHLPPFPQVVATLRQPEVRVGPVGINFQGLKVGIDSGVEAPGRPVQSSHLSPGEIALVIPGRDRAVAFEGRDGVIRLTQVGVLPRQVVKIARTGPVRHHGFQNAYVAARIPRDPALALTMLNQDLRYPDNLPLRRPVPRDEDLMDPPSPVVAAVVADAPLPPEGKARSAPRVPGRDLPPVKASHLR